MDIFARRPAPDVSASKEQRATAAHAARLALQRLDAAEALWSAGHGAEALALGASALETVCEAAMDFGPELAGALAKLGLDADEVHRLVTARDTEIPESDLELGPAHAALHVSINRLTKRVVASLRRL